MQALTIVFDLDGTLVDTAPDLVAATNHALSDLNLPLVSTRTLISAVGQGARYMIVEALRQQDVTLGEPDIERLLARFLAYYEANISRESRPFEGAVSALEGLAADGARLAVCTNKPYALSRRLLDELGLSALFNGAIAGRDTFPEYKPHPNHLTGAVRLAGGDPRQAIMVGDTRVDIATARAADIPVVGCAFGYSDVPIATLEPDVVIGHYSELRSAVAAIAGRPTATPSGS
jgi:phosphoglycolate phosphatase